jgi:hypothetical protein
MTTIIATNVDISLHGYKFTSDVEHDADQHALLFPATEDGPQDVISINLEAYGLKPKADDHVFIKDWSEHSGLTESLTKAGVVEVVGAVNVGPFSSRAYEVKVIAEKIGE